MDKNFEELSRDVYEQITSNDAMEIVRVMYTGMGQYRVGARWKESQSDTFWFDAGGSEPWSFARNTQQIQSMRPQ